MNSNARYSTAMDPNAQKKIDEIMYETNERVSAIVNEIGDVRFSKMNEDE